MTPNSAVVPWTVRLISLPLADTGRKLYDSGAMRRISGILSLR